MYAGKKNYEQQCLDSCVRSTTLLAMLILCAIYHDSFKNKWFYS